MLSRRYTESRSFRLTSEYISQHINRKVILYSPRVDVTHFIINLLRKYPSYFNFADIINKLPDSWRLDIIAPLIKLYVRELEHRNNNNLILKAMVQSVEIRTQDEYFRAAQGRIVLDATQKCHLCSEVIGTPEFVVMPSNEIIHLQCHLDSTIRGI